MNVPAPPRERVAYSLPPCNVAWTAHIFTGTSPNLTSLRMRRLLGHAAREKDVCTTRRRRELVGQPHVSSHNGDGGIRKCSTSRLMHPSLRLNNPSPANDGARAARIEQGCSLPVPQGYLRYSGYGPLCGRTGCTPTSPVPVLMPRAKNDNRVARQTGTPGVRMLSLTVPHVLSAGIHTTVYRS